MATAYQIRISSQLDPRFSRWFGDLAITHTLDGDTLLTGSLVDQAALYGVLERCRDMGVTLISINPLPDWQRDAQNQIYQGKGPGDNHE